MANGLTDHAIPLTQCSWAQWYAWGVQKAMEKARAWVILGVLRNTLENGGVKPL
jgi:hypothetical protein